MATGGGHNQLEETMSTLGVPVMTNFVQSEHSIGEWWWQQLQESMVSVEEEKRLGEEKGDYHEPIPATTVIIHGSWSKRSHEHSYNAKSGVAIIMGKRWASCCTLVWAISTAVHALKASPKIKANATKNGMPLHLKWKHIILKGFTQWKKVHALQWWQRQLRVLNFNTQCTIWDHAVRKTECANHACKCYCAGLESLYKPILITKAKEDSHKEGSED